MVGIYSLAIGLLGLGFLLDFVSVPVLTGFISATALITGFGQVDSLVGLKGVPRGVFNQIGNILRRFPEWDGPTCGECRSSHQQLSSWKMSCQGATLYRLASWIIYRFVANFHRTGIGFGTIIVLLALEKVGKTWGTKHFAIKYAASSRAVIALVIFTLISYLVNKDRKDDLLWSISMVDTHGIVAPKVHDRGLISKVATRAVAPLLACTLEHLGVGKAFGRKNGYEIDESQEFNYLGITNIVNSFFGAMPVGGAMSRTAVASECGVRSPLNGIVTAVSLNILVKTKFLYPFKN